jgi:hypothetical protein
MPFEGMSRHLGVTNTLTTLTRCLRRMPGFEGFWFSCRTSSAETSITHGCGTYGAAFLNKEFRTLYEFIGSGLVRISGLPAWMIASTVAGAAGAPAGVPVVLSTFSSGAFAGRACSAQLPLAFALTGFGAGQTIGL